MKRMYLSDTSDAMDISREACICEIFVTLARMQERVGKYGEAEQNYHNALASTRKLIRMGQLWYIQKRFRLYWELAGLRICGIKNLWD